MIKIMKPGLLASVQDMGRYGYQKYGVIASGVMDPLAHRIANLLVGNEENQPTIEVTLLGPLIEFQEDALISICGGDLSPSIYGQPVPMWRTIFVAKGSMLRFGSAESGCRAYLAVAGGLDVAPIMGSKSTYLRAEIDGHQGRALKPNDEVAIGEQSELSVRIMDQLHKNDVEDFVEARWSVATSIQPNLDLPFTIRVIKGRQFDWFSEKSKRQFQEATFSVTSQSDRMGYRLEGSTLELSEQKELISEAVSFGTIQVPSDGNPIVLLADRQTTGGYPKIAQIVSVDLSLMAQAKPGDKLRFEFITHEEAQELFITREAWINQVKHAIRLNVGGE